MFATPSIELGIDVKRCGKLILTTYSHVRKTHADEMAKKLI